jgi:hypothetical protein
VAWIPSPTAVGIGMLLPAAVIFVMFLGSIVDRLWWRADRQCEALVAVIVPLLVLLGILRA